MRRTEPQHPGDWLRDQLDARKLSLENFARRCKIDPSALRKFIDGRRRFTSAYAMAMAAELGISDDQIMAVQAQWDTRPR